MLLNIICCESLVLTAFGKQLSWHRVIHCTSFRLSICFSFPADFCQTPLPTALATRSLSKIPSGLSASPRVRGSISPLNKVPSSFAFLIGETEYLSISLTPSDCAFDHDPSHPPKSSKCTQLDSSAITSLNVSLKSDRAVNNLSVHVTKPDDIDTKNSIHLLCPSVVTVGTLHHLLLSKYQLDPVRQIVDIYLGDECLEPSHSLREVAFLYAFPARKQRMCLIFTFAEACFAWWGRPMPRLERPRPKESIPNGWSHPRHRRDSSSPEQTSWNHARHSRVRSKSGEHFDLVLPSQSRTKRSSL